MKHWVSIIEMCILYAVVNLNMFPKVKNLSFLFVIAVQAKHISVKFAPRNILGPGFPIPYFAYFYGKVLINRMEKDQCAEDALFQILA